MVSTHPCQCVEPAEGRALVKLAPSEFGRMNVLFNLAAISYLVALFLASEESSSATGVDIVVDGGMKVW